MSDINPLKILQRPKMPAPQIIQSPVANNDVSDQNAIEAERRRRALAVGSSGNIVSSLAGATGDAAAVSRKKLLGG
jgi:hypothetical protein